MPTLQLSPACDLGWLSRQKPRTWTYYAVVAHGLLGCATPLPPVPSTPTIIPPTQEIRVEPLGAAHALKGLVALQLNDEEMATTELRLAIVHNDTSPFLWRRLANAWQQQGELGKAYAIITEATQRFSDDAAVLAQAGTYAYALGDYASARKLCTQVSILAPGSDAEKSIVPIRVRAQLWMAPQGKDFGWLEAALNRHRADVHIHREVGAAFEDHARLPEATYHYAQHLKLQPSDITATTALARVLEFRGLYTQASKRLIKLLRYFPESAAVYGEIYRLNMLAGNDTDAGLFRTTSLGEHVDQPSGTFAIALSDFALSRAPQALELLLAFLERKATPTDAAGGLNLWARVFARYPEVLATDKSKRLETHCIQIARRQKVGAFLARCLAAAGKTGAALKLLSRTVAKGPGRPTLQTAEFAALLVSNHKSPVQAQRLWKKFIAALDKRYRLSVSEKLLAELALQDAMGNADKVLNTVQRLEKIEPNNIGIALRHAGLLVKYKGLHAGLATLETLLRADPQDPQRLNALGYALITSEEERPSQYGQQRLHEAEVYLRQAVRLAQSDGYVLDSLAWALHLQGKEEAALRTEKRALRFAPPDAELFAHLSAIHLARDELHLAYGAHNTAMRLLPKREVRESLATTLVEVQKRMRGVDDTRASE